MSVLVSNLQEKVPVDEELNGLVIRVTQEVLHTEGVDPAAEVSLVFVDEDYIQRLNREYRGVDRPTDVLSFALEEGEPMPAGGGEVLLGDVVVSLPAAQRQSVEYGHSFAREVAFLTVHGVLHLLGYDHQTEEESARMRAREEAVLAQMGLSRQVGEDDTP